MHSSSYGSFATHHGASEDDVMPELSHLKRSGYAKEIWSAIDRDGGVIVDDFIAADLLARLQDELMPFVADHDQGGSKGRPCILAEFSRHRDEADHRTLREEPRMGHPVRRHTLRRTGRSLSGRR